MAINRSLMDRQLYQQGGGAIYPRIDGLSSGISGAEQELQDILQSIDQVQSTLGAPSEGEGDGYPKIPAGQGITVPFNTGVQAGTMNQNGTGMTTGIALNPGVKPDPGSFGKPPRQGTPYNPGRPNPGRPLGGGNTPFDPRFAGSTLSQLMGSDFSGGVGDPRTGAAFIPGNPLQEIMRNTKANGGIMSVSPRQQYGLGSFVKKAVKGVTGGIKKIAGSKFGKAALLGGLGMYAGGLGPFGAQGMFSGAKGAGFLGNMFSGGFPGLETAKKILGGEPTLGKTLGIGVGGSLLGTLFAKAQEGDEEAIGATRNVEALRSYLSNGFKDLGYSDEEIPALVEQNVSEYTSGQGGYAVGGRVGAMYGGRMKLEDGTLDPRIREIVIKLMDDKENPLSFGEAVKEAYKRIEQRAKGGRIGYAFGSDDLVEQASGIMNLPINQNKAGVKELDLRETGGFIPPVGVKEKADDIPAMLSNNEFVFTADSVREFGDGDVNKGAQRMYDMMKKLEKGGRV